MRIHKEGKISILITLILAFVLIAVALYTSSIIGWLLAAGGILLFIFILSFFRHPERTITNIDPAIIYSPADGKVVVSEIINDKEYFNDKRYQISIFMSPLNVHVNRVPVSGSVQHVKYHPGKYLVAWHPKSSELNERCVTVIKTGEQEIFIKQIAGAVARRVVCYMKKGMDVTAGEELGFIKFGSRCDILLPPDTEILVNIDDVVEGNTTPIARLAV